MTKDSLQTDKKDHDKQPKLLNSTSPLGRFYNGQKAVMRGILADYLDVHSVAALSSCHSALYAETQDKSYWVNKLPAAGCNKALLDNVLHANVIQHYKDLYHAFTRIEYRYRIDINNPWELLCLSGDARAITYAIAHEKITAETKNRWQESPLHIAALSGSPSAMTKALELKDAKGQSINPLAQTTTQQTVLHFAALSGSQSAMAKALELKDAKGQSINPLAQTTTQATVLHFAALSGSPSAMAKALELKDAKGQSIDSLAKTTSQQTLLHLAAWSGSVSAVTYLRILSHEFHLGFDPATPDAEKHDAFWYADQSKNSAAVRAALLAPIETLIAAQGKNEKNIKTATDEKHVSAPLKLGK